MVRRSTAVLLVAAAASVTLLQTAACAKITKKPFSLDDVLSGDFSPEPFLGRWISGSALLFEEEDGIRLRFVDTDEVIEWVPKEVFEQYKPMKPKVSDDWSYVLFAYDALKVFQHGGSARYAVYSIANDTTIEIGGGERLQAAVWGGDPGQLAYVLGNNIYYLAEPTAQPVQVTTDGVPEVVYNGVFDILSDASLTPAETLGDDSALEFSPDGSKLLFMQYDVSQVDNASFILQYGTPGALADQYAKPVTFRYQKVGRPKPKECLKIVNLPSENSTSVTIQQLMAPVDVVGEEYYILHYVWTEGSTLLVLYGNRARNLTQYVTYETSDKSAQLYGKKGLKLEQKGGWLNKQPTLISYGNSSYFLIIAWQPQGDAGSFPHIVKVSGDSMTPITSGQYTVTKLYGWERNGTVYYQATEEGHPSRRRVYAVEEGGTPRCLSCGVRGFEWSSPCLRDSASFSHDLSWYTLECSGPDPPVTTLHRAADNKLVEWEQYRNWELRKRLRGRLTPVPVDDWFDLEGGLRAQVRLLLPPDLDVVGEKRPALLYVYGGPGFQQIDDSFAVDVYSYFVTYRRYVVILIDGRGSGCHGDRMLFSIYRRLGTVEVDDQIAVTKKVVQSYRFIDSSRVGVWGWSYGGFATAMILAKDDEGIFRCGASVAPVTNWIYTDALYTETYMGQPTAEDNLWGYNASDVTRLAARLAGKRFLLAHGAADDVAFFQNSAMLARALQEAGVLFREQIYPDKHHSLRQRGYHVYNTMDQFFVECFDRSSILIDILREMVSSQ